MLATLRRAVRAAAAEGVDWREVVASLRPVTQALWRRMPLAEQQTFLRHLRPYWDSHRHRAAPETHRAISGLAAADRLFVHAARLTAVTPDGSTPARHAGPRRRARTLEVGALIDCTGPQRPAGRG